MNASSSPAKINTILRQYTNRLEAAGIGTARLDCLVLLEDATGKDRSWLLAHPDHTVQGPTLEALELSILRRITHEPLAYIRGKTEFYGREFCINNDVLEPRPESETMIDLLKQLIEVQKPKPKSQFTVVDVGTGSGALGITAALEVPNSKVIATDIDSKCLKVARQNAQNLDANVKFYQGNLLDPVPASSFQLPTSILANLPYVPDHYHINEAAGMEPRVAIFGGMDGLDIYRKLFAQVTQYPNPPLYILTESIPFQHKSLAKIARNCGFVEAQDEDFIQVFTPEKSNTPATVHPS